MEIVMIFFQWGACFLYILYVHAVVVSFKIDYNPREEFLVSFGKIVKILKTILISLIINSGRSF